MIEKLKSRIGDISVNSPILLLGEAANIFKNNYHRDIFKPNSIEECINFIATYEYKGNTDAAVHVPNIILSSLCCIVMNILVKFVSLSERDMYKIRNENKKLLEEMKELAGTLAAIDPEIPLHVTRFFPAAEMSTTPPTPVRSRARRRSRSPR